MRRTIPPKRPISIRTNTTTADSNSPLTPASSHSIENLTPDSILDLPVVFADENDGENLITNSNNKEMI